eukprot:6431354-Amphidinium_carterae.3
MMHPLPRGKSRAGYIIGLGPIGIPYRRRNDPLSHGGILNVLHPLSCKINYGLHLPGPAARGPRYRWQFLYDHFSTTGNVPSEKQVMLDMMYVKEQAERGRFRIN